MENERPVWRTVLSILITLFLVIRLVYTCSKMDDRNSSNDNINNLMNNQIIQQQVNQQQYNNTLSKKGNDLLYTPYKALDTLPEAAKKLFSVLKMKNDSLITFDLTTKIKVDKNYYYQNNHDDSLRMAFKSPKDLNVFIHDFDSKQSEESNFKTLKKNVDLKHFKFENILKKTKTISYIITKNKTKFNGFAISFKTDDYQSFIEFESDRLSGLSLELEALSFLKNNLKQTKNTIPK